MKETKHLLYWQWIWFTRWLRTTYHLFNRKAYRKWKQRDKAFPTICFDDVFEQSGPH
jgi:hypothetical protein